MLSRTDLLKELLSCWIWDIDFLIDLCNNNEIDLDLEDIQSNYGSITINNMIYEAIRTIAWKFIEENKAIIEKILNTNDLDDYLSYNDIYEIYTNYLDSHLWFTNNEIQDLFENSKYTI